ncbi:hypothetical protein [Microbacterium sp. NPDC090003]|uniref:hypothetical protein n=1 Tax=Microbacterium sp. NPDC090003 TaxID=3364203 RepID=UPI00380F8DE4
MPSPRRHLAAALAFAAASVLALAGCTANADVDSPGEVAASTAVIEEFFAHLEAGETTEAAAMTEIDFPRESLDEDFYTASGVTPSDLKVVETTGDDSYAVTATVEFVLDDPDRPATAKLKVTNTDGERTIGWEYSTYSVIMPGSPGRIVVNDELEFAQSDDAQELILLPGLYDFEYVDRTGTTHLDPDGTNEFRLAFPVPGPILDLPYDVNVTAASLSSTSSLPSGTSKAVEAEIDLLTEACVAESMAGPSCPPEVLAYDGSLVATSTIHWFPGIGQLDISDGVVEYTLPFTVQADGEGFPLTAAYAGTVTADADGNVVFTRTK